MYINPTLQDVKIPSLTVEDFMSHLQKRQYYPYGYNNYGYSGFYSYGRWILLGVILGVVVLVWAMLFLCNRRRTRRGQGAVPYTGWATPGVARPQTNMATHPQPYPQGQYAPQQGQYQPQMQQGYVPQGQYQPQQYGQAPPQYPATAASREK